MDLFELVLDVENDVDMDMDKDMDVGVDSLVGWALYSLV
jgi:hypothetical protein